MERSDEQRYLFHSNALALGGRIDRPFQEIIESQASVVLPITGGYGSVCAEKFRHRDIVSFESARATVIGDEHIENGRRTFHTLTTSTLEGLNVGNVVTADAVVGRLVSKFDLESDERETTPIGSHFVNLRIAGMRVHPRPRGALFESKSVHELAHACRREPTLSLYADDLARLSHGEPDDSHQGRHGDRPPRGRVLVPLFDLEDDYFPPGTKRRGDGGIRVPGFGTVYLGEFFVARATRRLTMLRIELGCPVEGTVVGSDVHTNGSAYP